MFKNRRFGFQIIQQIKNSQLKKKFKSFLLTKIKIKVFKVYFYIYSWNRFKENFKYIALHFKFVPKNLKKNTL